MAATLEDLARRVEELERLTQPLRGSMPGPDEWQSAVGMFAGSDFMKQVDEEGRRLREAEREAARSGGPV